LFREKNTHINIKVVFAVEMSFGDEIEDLGGLDFRDVVGKLDYDFFGS
jgi:hypothetical protein